jgi:hypothetical protein
MSEREEGGMRNTTTQTTKDAAVLRELAEGLREELLTLTARDVDEIAERIDALVRAGREILKAQAAGDLTYIRSDGRGYEAMLELEAALDNLQGEADE